MLFLFYYKYTHKIYKELCVSCFFLLIVLFKGYCVMVGYHLKINPNKKTELQMFTAQEMADFCLDEVFTAWSRPSSIVLAKDRLT